MSLRFVLWDIDHTLIELRRLHYDLYAQTLPLAFGREADQLPDMTGRTDRDSSTEFLRSHGIEVTENHLTRFWNALVQQLDTAFGDLARHGHATMGAIEAVKACAEVRDLHQSILTGNLRPLAERKLNPFGFSTYLDYPIGGYGEDALRRGDLVGVAHTRLKELRGIDARPEQTVLVGDTPLDVEAAKASGAKVIGVATGKSSVSELYDVGADVALPTLIDTAEVLRAIKSVVR